MEISYQRKHDKSVMVLATEPADSLFARKMIEKNSISALLPFFVVDMDGMRQYNYDITGKEDLRDFLQREGVTRKVLADLFLHLHLAFEQVGKYLIPLEDLVIKPETVFMDKAAAGSIGLCFCPGESSGKDSRIKEIMEFVLTVVDHSDKTLMLLCYELYEMTLHEGCGPMQLLDYLNSQEEAPKVEVVDLRTEEKNQPEAFAEDFFEEDEEEDFFNISDKLLDIKEKFLGTLAFKKPETKEKKKLFEWHKKSESREFVDFEDMEEEDICGATQVLTPENCPIAGKLIYDGPANEDNFIIEKDSFRIGTDRWKNDGIVKSKTVSRLHASITREGGKYYISDLNSTNGTRVNDQVLAYNQKQVLHSMDRIRFADVAYVFM